MSKPITAALFALAMLTIIASPSHSETKTYPGTVCVYDSGGVPNPATDGSLGNASRTEDMYVVCPIVRDLTHRNARPRSVHVFSYNPDITFSISCLVRSCFGSCSDGSTASSDRSSVWNNVRTPGPPLRAGDMSTYWSHLVRYNLVCEIPPGASIESYYVWEE